ncbi:PAS domain-containing sensor histidine kinase [Pedobacter sp. SAFR-022]|uniref:PAS domain-containing sensor histidine kinase n=1 Tax=Pedobacter sp. SAFR-022 TaxID=3436861 RepID=UPI003F7F2FD3
MDRTINNKEQVIELLNKRIETSKGTPEGADTNISDYEISVLLNELQIFQLELEMQNEELKVSYQLLEAERAKLAGFFNHAPVGFFILDSIGFISEANQTGADLLKVQRKALFNRRFHSFFEGNNLSAFSNFLDKVANSQQRQYVEISLFPEQKYAFYARLEGVAILDPVTEKLQFYITVADITESREAQQKLLDTSHRLAMTLNASDTGTWTMNFKRQRIFLDEYSNSIFEIEPGTFDGRIRNFLSFIHPKDRSRVTQVFDFTAAPFGKLDIEFEIITRNGKHKVIYAQGNEIQGLDEQSYFAGIIMDITEKTNLAKEAVRLQEENQRNILSATFKAQEKERLQISSALHDSICQILYGIKINLQNIQRSHNMNIEFKNVNLLLDQVIRETREMSYELTPSVLRDFGFAAGIQELGNRLSIPGFKIVTDINADFSSLNEEKQLYLFRIIQELINNCMKHAEASLAEIKMFEKDGWLNLTFKDNGKGFGVKVERSLLNGSGLRSIKNRIFLLNGEMELQSSSLGTIIEIRIKYDNLPHN